MFKIDFEKVSFVVMFLLLIKNCSLPATQMTNEQNTNCHNIALADKKHKTAAYKKFIESLSDAKTGEKLRYHSNQQKKIYNDLNKVSKENLFKFCDSINKSHESLSMQDALNVAYSKEIEGCKA
jgi:hypothetical protein